MCIPFSLRCEVSRLRPDAQFHTFSSRRLRASLAIHRVGWLLALAVLIQFPYRLFSLKGGEASAGMRFVVRWFGYFLLVMLLGNWVLDMVVFGS